MLAAATGQGPRGCWGCSKAGALLVQAKAAGGALEGTRYKAGWGKVRQVGRGWEPAGKRLLGLAGHVWGKALRWAVRGEPNQW